MKKLSLMTIIAAVLITVSAKANEPNNLNKIIISGTGDSFELFQNLAEAFEAKYSGCKIEIPESVGSTAGIKAVIGGKADIARVARPLKDNEKAAGLTEQVFANTPVVFAVRPDTNGIDNITTEQVLGIYKGEIKDWSQLGATAGKIYPLTREQGDSALRILVENMAGFADINSPAGKVMYLTPEAVATMLEHKQTICYLPLSAVVNTELKVLKIDGVEPTNKKVLSGEYKYLIPLGVVCKGEPKGLVKKFIDFLYSSDAGKIIMSMGAVPVQ
ncbi:MAG: hypothetical protein A2Y10_04465 [Planctomycetes bacterium GWF2_41_51]|nr:MAG: hypothetical protein A2Y10_04465 [Planctomycetes bacterium GWF2_41_51]HBG27038.1 hypothetical protein [Phycisphaerales bacterium]